MVRVWRFVLCVAARMEQQGERAYSSQAGRMTLGSKPPLNCGVEDFHSETDHSH